MSTYKVIQDIEAEDKILGPLTLRQFIYGLITAFFLYLCFIVVTKGAPFLLALFLPPAIFTGFFTFPFGKDQPTEVWAVAKIRFLFKPRRRIWDQSGVKELVTITVPKKIERIYTNGLTQTEVKSRLQALANTIDSRGWAIKNVNVNLYSQGNQLAAEASSDRLIAMSSMPQPVPEYEVQASDDILDEHNNPIAQQFNQMITANAQAHRQQLIDQMNSKPVASQPPAQTTPVDYWFMNPSGTPTTYVAPDQVSDSTTPAPITTTASSDDVAITTDEAAILNDLKSRNQTQQIANSHLHTIQPLLTQPTEPVPAQPTVPPVVAPPVTAPSDAAILNLASNNDLNVATLAREAQKSKALDISSHDEVVISLR